MKAKWICSLFVPFLVVFFAAFFTTPARAANEPETVGVAHYELSPAHFSLALQWTPIHYGFYDWNTGIRNGQTGDGFHVALNWYPVGDAIGQPAVGIGGGAYAIKDADLGNGTLGTLETFPVEAFVMYRASFRPRQTVVPFAKVGLDYTFSNQFSSTGGPRPGTQDYMGLDYGGGIEFCLSGLGPRGSMYLYQAIGVTSTYLALEYVKSEQLGWVAGPDLSHEEFRVGLRFDF